MPHSFTDLRPIRRSVFMGSGPIRRPEHLSEGSVAWPYQRKPAYSADPATHRTDEPDNFSPSVPADFKSPLGNSPSLGRNSPEAEAPGQPKIRYATVAVSDPNSESRRVGKDGCRTLY